MDGHKAELSAYNADYSTRHNTGKLKPRNVIKWNEQAYGAYDW